MSGVERGEEMRRQAERDFGWLGPLAPIVRPFAIYDRARTQAEAEGDGVPVRSAPAAPAVDYRAIPHDELHAMVNTEVDPGAVDAAADLWVGIGENLVAFRDDVAKALADDETEWTGAAADQARQAVVMLGDATGAAGRAARLAGALWRQQSAALSAARGLVVPPPPPFDANAVGALLGGLTDPIALVRQPVADFLTHAAQQATHLAAAEAVREYDGAVTRTSSSQPAFAAAVTGSEGWSLTGGGGAPSGGTTTSSSAPPVVDHRPVHPGPGAVPAPDQSGRPGTGWYPGAAGTSPGAAPRGTATGSGPSRGGGVSRAAVPGRTGFDRATGAGPLREGRRSAVAERAPAGPARTFGPHAGPADGHRPGPAGAPPNGYAGREEDKEHRIPEYLRERHPEEVFGPDPAIPPAVLGDWGSGEQWRHLNEPEP